VREENSASIDSESNLDAARDTNSIAQRKLFDFDAENGGNFFSFI